jgi:hypothetical protein
MSYEPKKHLQLKERHLLPTAESANELLVAADKAKTHTQQKNRIIICEEKWLWLCKNNFAHQVHPTNTYLQKIGFEGL